MKLGYLVAFFLLLASAGVPSSHALHLAFVDSAPTVMGDETPAVAAQPVDAVPASSLASEPAAAGGDTAAPDWRTPSSSTDTSIFLLLIAGVASMAFVARRR
jgi:hypothetical protein